MCQTASPHNLSYKRMRWTHDAPQKQTHTHNKHTFRHTYDAMKTEGHTSTPDGNNGKERNRERERQRETNIETRDDGIIPTSSQRNHRSTAHDQFDTQIHTHTMA